MSCRGRLRFGGIHDVIIEWSVDTQILADPSSFLYVFFQEILNRIQYFRLFSRDAACNDRSFDASFFCSAFTRQWSAIIHDSKIADERKFAKHGEQWSGPCWLRSRWSLMISGYLIYSDEMSMRQQTYCMCIQFSIWCLPILGCNRPDIKIDCLDRHELRMDEVTLCRDVSVAQLGCTSYASFSTLVWLQIMFAVTNTSYTAYLFTLSSI